MLKCDDTCSCPLGETCLGRRYPEWATVMRTYWESGDPVLRNHVIVKSQHDYLTPTPSSEVPSTTVTPTPEPVTTPGLASMAKSFVTTMVQEVKHVVTGGHALVSEETFQKRVSICRGERDHWDRCRYFQERPRLRCQKCGCDGEIAFRLPVKACPIGRWPAETEGH